MSSAAASEEEGPWPPGTVGLAVAILAVFALEHAAGIMDRRAVAALRLGALDNAAVFTGGEVWRLLTAAFVHFPLGGKGLTWDDGLLAMPHVLLNGWALIQLGTFVESVWGTARFLVVFLLSAIGCSLASAWFATGVSAGASGGLFGLMGFLLVARALHAPAVRALVGAVFGRQLLFWTLAVLALGVANPLQSAVPLDQAGHLGGLATGAVLGLLLRGTGEPDGAVRGLATGLVLATVGSFVLVASEGERSARLERAFEDAALAAQEGDRVAAGKALDEALGRDAASLARFVGKSPARALVLVEASVAAVRSADALRFAEAAGPLVGSPWSEALLATGRFANGETDRAREALDRAKATLAPADRVGLALFYEKVGWSGPALELLESALAQEPRDAGYMNAVAWVLLTAHDEPLRRPARGLELARRSVEAAPDQADSLDTLAEGELQAGLLQDALAHERRALDLARQRRDERLVKELSERLARIEARAEKR